MNESTSILVTGGAGFIGSHLVERLLTTTDRRVVVLDNFNDFYAPARKQQNLAGVRSHPRFALVAGDVADEQAVDRVWREHRVSDVIHLAAHAGVRPSLERPLPYVDANVRGTLVLLEAARRHGCRRFLSASSATVYGNDAPVPFREDRLGRTPASPYGVTKRAAELMCRLYYDLYRVPVLSLRFFSAYGPRLRPDLAMCIFARAILDERPLPLFGGGTAERDFTYIDDIVNGVVAALASDAVGDEVNLGNNRPIAIRRIVELLEAAIGKPARIDALPEKPGEMRITCADVSKAAQLFGYEPRVPIEQGIVHFVRWYTSEPAVTRS
jgi:UDP-glucuronate 4-epimerase